MALFAGLLCLDWTSADEGYRQPDFAVVLFDQTALALPQEQRIELAWALTSLARNFPDDATITPRAKAMALLLSHHFLPFDRDIVVGNFHLRHGLATRPTGHYKKKEEIIARIESIVSIEGAEEPDSRLRELLTDVLDEVLNRESKGASLWDDAVPPRLRPLKQLTARVQFFDESGKFCYVTGVAKPLTDGGAFSIIHEKRSQVLSPTFHDDLALSHPFVARHFEMTLTGDSRSLDSRMRRDTLVRLLIEQMVDGWSWDLRTALCGVGEDLSNERVFARLDATVSRSHSVDAILMPSLPPAAFRNWMAFDQLDRLTLVELIAANSVREVIAWHAEDADRDTARALFLRCVPMLGKRITSPEEISLNRRLLTWLAEIEEAVPSHLSTTVLRKYGTLAKPPRATFAASLDWLDKQAGSVMGVSSQGHNRNFREKVCDPLLKTLWNVDRRLDLRTKDLCKELAQYIDYRSIPFTRVANKGTNTGRRQYMKLTGAQAEWRRMKRQVESELSTNR